MRKYILLITLIVYFKHLKWLLVIIFCLLHYKKPLKVLKAFFICLAKLITLKVTSNQLFFTFLMHIKLKHLCSF